MRRATPESRARRRWGQNFLVDAGGAAAIAAAFDPRPADRVLEIGPGRGALTRRLLGRVALIRAIEIDPALAGPLSDDLQRTESSTDVAILNQDVLETDLHGLLTDMGASAQRPARVIANLPYNIATAVILRLLQHGRMLDDLLVMVQREVAERIMSPPGRKSYGSLSVLCQASARVESVLRLGPESFRPRPKVDSEVIRLTPLNGSGLATAGGEPLSTLLRVAFQHRRKTLLNNLAAAIGHLAADDILRQAGLPPGARPESIPVEGFLTLLNLWVQRRTQVTGPGRRL